MRAASSGRKNPYAHHPDAQSELLWHDAWAQLHPAEPGYTFESNSPTKRIDYAWLNAALLPSLKHVRIVADQPDIQGSRASDHLGLTVTLE